MSAETGKGDKQPLDDIMLAMDVVDTLRHQQLLVKRELDTDDRDQKMLQRLREIYAAQGIEVPDHVLQQGVDALKEGRFVYQPPASSFQVWLARLYISRGRWGKPVLLVAGLILVLWLAYYFFVSGPAGQARDALPGQIQAQYEQLLEQAEWETAIERSESLLLEGKSALQRQEMDEARQVLERMAVLQRDIELEYDIRISSHPGGRSGVWRIPDANTMARNYYIIVEAVSRYGNLETVPVLNEEDGKVYRVKEWGLRVDEELFDRVAEDKTDDGIIQDNRFGVKKRGYLAPQYLMPTTGAAITRW